MADGDLHKQISRLGLRSCHPHSLLKLPQTIPAFGCSINHTL